MSTAPLRAASPADFLILPPSVSRNRGHGTKVNKCLSCGDEFPLDHPEKFGRHVRQCSEAHAPEAEAELAAKENYFQSIADTELYAAVREGRA